MESATILSFELFSTGGATGLVGALLLPHWQFAPQEQVPSAQHAQPLPEQQLCSAVRALQQVRSCRLQELSSPQRQIFAPVQGQRDEVVWLVALQQA